ncbi:leucyl/phenylalanyl-tRNA--protein transferase [Paractinoplanes abujensis]|uniref:Leucyl/phenylalanyl-tRNA--protein transferase n=1 Tax=Paractinoplanes abujensis TaxID=882441 RepID=A0A7W7CLW5_9ACTN|nr:leucyl/phenylalanyl-tRNA--protein transferase [Actinoplanes abujensis]MBB4690975.1 leucyl/phenylalanyl-tRNA--protein transferase [Actinoplanes abujensis]GID17612.1 leucyl/phenylalanyl-tRNA--protein transferase [Actinoplanes abujensis]
MGRGANLGLELRGALRAFGFPPVSKARSDGLLAVGGDLGPERLLVAYANGIFPWPTTGSKVLPWFCPSPRTVLVPGQITVGRSVRRVVRRRPYTLTFDRAFPEVIEACSVVPRADDGTWITPAMVQGYIRLHELGFAHSVEAWDGDELVGGLYGVSLGAAFFGESMFRRASDASKVALIELLDQLHAWDFRFVDCQMMTPHVRRLGAQEWEMDRFQLELGRALERETRRGPWSPAAAD